MLLKGSRTGIIDGWPRSTETNRTTQRRPAVPATPDRNAARLHRPGLEEENLYRGRYLAHDYDFRDILGDLLITHLESPNLGTILPGHSFTSTGVLA